MENQSPFWINTTNDISKIEQDLKVSVENVKSMILKNFIVIYETEWTLDRHRIFWNTTGHTIIELNFNNRKIGINAFSVLFSALDGNFIRKTCPIIYGFLENARKIRISTDRKCNQNLPIISYLVAIQCLIVNLLFTALKMINLPIHWSLCGRLSQLQRKGEIHLKTKSLANIKKECLYKLER